MFKKSTDSVKFREYERIYTGHNQDIGYENPVLQYTSYTTLQMFPADKTTYFHYPLISTSAMLVDSDLVRCGAIAGSIPFSSDKIWKKMANYTDTSIWGDSHPVGKQTGVWLCSWLSGNPSDINSTPQWMDRWYNPGYVDPSNAMFVSNPASSIIIDIQSEMILEPGCYYKYFHVGNKTNEYIVNSLSANNNLCLHLDDWNEKQIDNSSYKNYCEIENFNSDCISYVSVNPISKPSDSCLKLNGINQHCHVLYSSSYAVTGDLTFNLWTYADDWNNIQGNHILSKNYRGGWSFKYNNGFFNPIIFIADRNQGKIAFLNNSGDLLISKTLPNISNPISVALDSEMFTWVLDNGVYNNSKHLYKIDYNGDILDAIYFGNNEELKSVSIDKNNNLWVLGGGVSAFDSKFLTLISTTTTLSTNNYIDVDMFGNVCLENTVFTFDNSGNKIFSNDSDDVLTMTKDQYIWKITDINTLLKTDLSGGFILSSTFGNSLGISGRNIGLTNEYNVDRYDDFVWVMQENEQYLYKYDTEGSLVKRIDLTKYHINPTIMGDFTGYQRDRKFNYLLNNGTQMQVDIHLNTNPLSGSKYTLSVPVSTLSNLDWHMFSFIKRSDNIEFYVDTVLVDSKSVMDNSYIYYDYENPLIVGANVGRIQTLDEELNINKTHFKGKVDDLRIYNVPLNISDLRHIYFNKYNYSDLNWNMPIAKQSYLEEVERFFKFKLTGMKSQYYNIKLIGLQVYDEDTRSIIEDSIKSTIKKVAPAYAELYKIIWE